MKRRAEKGFPHDLDTSVWRSGKKGRLRCGGAVWNRRKRSSNLPLCGSTGRSADQSRLNLAAARVITSTSSSYWGERGGAKCSTFPVSTSSEEDTRSAEAAARGEVTAGRASNLGERSWDLTGEDGDRDSLVSDPSTRSRCEPHERRLRSASAEAGPAPRGTLMKEPSPEKRAFRERSTRRGRLSQSGQSAPSRAASACLAPKQSTHKLCVSPAHKKRLQGGTHCLYCASLSQIHRALAEWQKADAGFTARAFIPAGHYVTSPVTFRPSMGQIAFGFRAGHAEGVPLASFGRSSSSWRGTTFFQDSLINRMFKRTFCSIINVFTVTFDQFNASFKSFEQLCLCKKKKILCIYKKKIMTHP